MKKVIGVGVLVVIGLTVLAVGVDAAAKLVRGQEFAQVGGKLDGITIFKVEDGEATCYVSRQGQFGVHAISCVR